MYGITAQMPRGQDHSALVQQMHRRIVLLEVHRATATAYIASLDRQIGELRRELAEQRDQGDREQLLGQGSRSTSVSVATTPGGNE